MKGWVLLVIDCLYLTGEGGTRRLGGSETALSFVQLERVAALSLGSRPIVEPSLGVLAHEGVGSFGDRLLTLDA